MILFRTSTVSTRNVFVTIYNPTRVNHTSGHIRVACPKILHHVAGVERFQFDSQFCFMSLRTGRLQEVPAHLVPL